MARLAREGATDPRIRELSSYPVGTLDGWVRRRFVYRPELEEIIRAVPFQLEDLQRLGYLEGDCDDVSTFLAAALLPRPVRFVAIRTDPTNPEFLHVFVETLDAGRWVRLDPTVRRGTRHRYVEAMTEDV